MFLKKGNHSTKFSRDKIFAGWPFTKFHGNNIRGLRIVGSHSHSYAAAACATVLVVCEDTPIHVVKLL